MKHKTMKAKPETANGADMKRRGNHSGRLELRGKKWLAIWMVNGKRRSQSTGETQREAAEKWLARKLESVKTADGMKALDKEASTIREMQAALLKGELQRIKEDRAELESARTMLTFDEAWVAYERSPRRRPVVARTLQHMKTRFTRFTAWIAGKYPDVRELRAVTPGMAEEYAAAIRPTLVSSTYNMTIAALSQVWTTLAREIGWTANPWARDNLPRFTPPESARRVITDDELARIFDAARREIPPLHNLFTVMLYTGARLGDCASLKWEDIDLERGFLSFVPMKCRRFGERARVKIPILAPLRVILDSYPEKGRTGFILPDMAKLYAAGALSNRITEFLRRKCGIETQEKGEGGKRARSAVCAHAFRHTFVSKAANAGIPFAIVQRIVGHQTAEMSRHYFHENDDATLRAFAAFPTTRPAELPPPTATDVIDAEFVATETDGESGSEGTPAAVRLAAIENAIEEIIRNGNRDEIENAARRLAQAAAGMGAQD